MREENVRATEINHELGALKAAKKKKADSEHEWKNDMLFPSTTNQEYINGE